jgi:hypothetical protein
MHGMRRGKRRQSPGRMPARSPACDASCRSQFKYTLYESEGRVGYRQAIVQRGSIHPMEDSVAARVYVRTSCGRRACLQATCHVAGRAENLMPHTFPVSGQLHKLVGRTPWSAPYRWGGPPGPLHTGGADPLVRFIPVGRTPWSASYRWGGPPGPLHTGGADPLVRAGRPRPALSSNALGIRPGGRLRTSALVRGRRPGPPLGGRSRPIHAPAGRGRPARTRGSAPPICSEFRR